MSVPPAKCQQFTEQCIHIMLGLFFAMLPSSAIADIQTRYVETLRIDYAEIMQPIANYKVDVKGILGCSSLCLNTETCLSVLYHRETRDCRLNTQQVVLQYDAVVPSLSATHTLVPLSTNSWARHTTTTTTTTTTPTPPTTTTTAGGSANIWVSHGSSCYFFVNTEKVNWDDALQRCIGQNSYLVEVTSSTEDAFLRSIITNSNGDYTDVWTGGNDHDIEDTWVWGYPSGEAMSYTNWGGVEPNNVQYGPTDPGEDCMGFYAGRAYKWGDFRCTSLNYYVCEKDGANGC